MLRAGQKLGKYRLLTTLSVGTFATVFRAFDTLEGVYVALKIPHPNLMNKDALADWLESLGLELERYRSTGNPRLDRKTLEDYKDMYEEVAPAISLRNALSDLHTNKLVVGPDERNRTWLAPFGSITGRCQPSSSENVLGLSRFYRNLILAPPGRALLAQPL